MVLKALPTLGPSIRMTAITTIATKTMMIAYSTVAQLGYMLFVFPLAAASGVFAIDAWTGAFLQILAHGIAKASMFLSAGAIVAARPGAGGGVTSANH